MRTVRIRFVTLCLAVSALTGSADAQPTFLAWTRFDWTNQDPEVVSSRTGARFDGSWNGPLAATQRLDAFCLLDSTSSELWAPIDSDSQNPSLTDVYWEYYGDCDRWGVIFQSAFDGSRPNNLLVSKTYRCDPFRSHLLVEMTFRGLYTGCDRILEVIHGLSGQTRQLTHTSAAWLTAWKLELEAYEFLTVEASETVSVAIMDRTTASFDGSLVEWTHAANVVWDWGRSTARDSWNLWVCRWSQSCGNLTQWFRESPNHEISESKGPVGAWLGEWHATCRALGEHIRSRTEQALMTAWEALRLKRPNPPSADCELWDLYCE